MLTLLCAVFSTAWGTDFTLSSADEVTKDGITVSFAKGLGTNDPAWYSAGLRLYAKNTITISSETNITNIVFNWEKQGSKDFANVTASQGTYTHPTTTGDGTWTGSTKSITFTLGTSGQLQLNTFSVTLEGQSSLSNPQFSFLESEKTLFVDDTYNNQIQCGTTALNDITNFSYRACANSDGTGETNVVTVSEDGTVTAANAGNAYIFASWQATGTWKDGSIHYRVNVGRIPTEISGLENMEFQIGDDPRSFELTTNNPDGAISVESNNNEVATVTADGNTLTVTAVGRGNATISITQEATRKYTSATASFTVKVTKALPEGTIFYESFDTNQGSGGNDDNWSGSIASNNIKFDNQGWTSVKGNGAYECAKFGTGSAVGSATTPSIRTMGDVILSFKAGAWDGNSENTTLSLSSSEGTISPSSVTLVKGAFTEYEVTISGLNNVNFTITFSGSGGNNRFFLDEVLVRQAINVSIGSTGYATLYYSDKAFVVPEGVTAITYTTDGEGHIVRSKEYKTSGGNGTFIPQGEAVVLKGDPGTYTFVTTTATADPDDDNALHGFDTASQTTAPTNDDYYFYKLSKASPINGEDAADNTVGFWWGATGGAAFEIPAHKAYLAILQSEFPTPTEVTESFVFDETVGINKVQKDALSAEDIYTLSGIRVNGDNLSKGVYIVNGKKIVIK